MKKTNILAITFGYIVCLGLFLPMLFLKSAEIKLFGIIMMLFVMLSYYLFRKQLITKRKE